MIRKVTKPLSNEEKRVYCKMEDGVFYYPGELGTGYVTFERLKRRGLIRKENHHKRYAVQRLCRYIKRKRKWKMMIKKKVSM